MKNVKIDDIANKLGTSTFNLPLVLSGHLKRNIREYLINIYSTYSIIFKKDKA